MTRKSANKTGTGGVIHHERKKPSEYNVGGTSRARFAGEPNEDDWPHEGLVLENGELARQCAGTAYERICKECGCEYHHVQGKCPECSSEEKEVMRCQNIAVPGYMTCAWHGGGQKRTKHDIAKARRGSITNGVSVSEIMLCPCKMHGDTCPYKDMYFDDDGISRCFPEKQFYDSIVNYFKNTYDLDDAADLLMLNRLAMTLTRIMRGEKIVAKQGEIVERERFTEGGSERWFEQSSASKAVDQLDKRLQAWLKELAVTKSAREGKKVTVDLASELTNITKDSKEMIEL